MLCDLSFSPYCIVMYTPLQRLNATISSYLEMKVPDHMTVLFYGFPKSNMYAKDFPVNLLRNIGIRTVTTSHFLMLDMDMWINGIFELID